MKHVSESVLALYASRDLRWWARWSTALHVRRCGECRELVEVHRSLRADARGSAGVLPEGLDWERLSSEMTANIHVGLAAGECVTPPEQRRERRSASWFLHPVTAIVGLAIVFSAAWWLNMPEGDKVALGRVMRGLPARSGPVAGDDRGPMVAATSSGIEFWENGSSLGLGLTDAEPLEVSLSAGGSASAHYVDDDTGQVTITTVYVQ